ERSYSLPTWQGETIMAIFDTEHGEWDRALHALDTIIDGGLPSAEWAGARLARADIRLARGDDPGFARELAAALDRLPEQLDQTELAEVVYSAALMLEVGRRSDAEALVDAAFAIWTRPYGGSAVVDMA